MSQIPKSQSDKLLWQIVLALVIAVGMARGASAETSPAYGEWFKFGREVNDSWQVSEGEDAFHVSIRRNDGGNRTSPRRVLVLYPRPSSAYDIAITRILEVFAEKNMNAEITVVNFDKKDELGDKALKLANDGKYELIFSMGSESTAWLFDRYRDGPIPVVSVCSKDPVQLGQARGYDSGSGTNFAFTSLNMPIDAQMAYVMELKPELKNIGVLVDSKNVSAVQTQAEPITEYARQRGVKVHNIAVQDPAQAGSELAQLVPKAIAAMRKNDPTLDNSVLWITGSTSIFNEIAVINTNSDRVPVLSAVPEVVKAGDNTAVLSIGISFQSNAHLAAIYGADVLAGRARIGELKVGVVSPPDIAINFRRARDIGLQIPFSFFESATFVYDYEGQMVRNNGKPVAPAN